MDSSSVSETVRVLGGQRSTPPGTTIAPYMSSWPDWRVLAFSADGDGGGRSPEHQAQSAHIVCGGQRARSRTR
jgi:hypothetical protein